MLAFVCKCDQCQCTRASDSLAMWNKPQPLVCPFGDVWGIEETLDRLRVEQAANPSKSTTKTTVRCLPRGSLKKFGKVPLCPQEIPEVGIGDLGLPSWQQTAESCHRGCRGYQWRALNFAMKSGTSCGSLQDETYLPGTPQPLINRERGSGI